MTMTATNDTEGQSPQHNTERELDCPAVPGSLSPWTEKHAVTTDYASGNRVVMANDCADLEDWAMQAARAIESWALDESIDLSKQMPGCRGLLEICPVDFHSANVEVEHE